MDSNVGRFIEFDPETGITVKFRQEIVEDIKSIFKQAYGDDYEIVEGTEVYTLIDVLSSALKEYGDATKAVYDSTTILNATGAPLEALCASAGIYRQANESDTQLRARYYKMLYTPSVGTVQGLKAKLAAHITSITDAAGISKDFYTLSDVTVYNNATAAEDKEVGGVDIPPWSILAVGRLNDNVEEAYPSTDTSDCINNVIQPLSEIVTTYKSLGCGAVSKEYTYDETGTFTSYFYVAERKPFYFNITLSTKLNESVLAAVQKAIRNRVTAYVNGLRVGDNVMYSGIYSAVYNAYCDVDGADALFDVTKVEYKSSGDASLKTLAAGSSIPVYRVEYAYTEEVNVEVVNPT